MRAFLGIALTGPVVATLQYASQAIRDASPAWRGEKWVPVANLHITIRFLGEVPDAAVGDLYALTAGVASQHPIHEIVLAGVAARPKTKSATMLWATFGGRVDATTTLADALSEALVAAGYARAEHPFAPHATLVRARRPRSIDSEVLHGASRTIEAAAVADRTMSVAEVTLFSSTLTPQGPRYQLLGTAGLVRD